MKYSDDFNRESKRNDAIVKYGSFLLLCAALVGILAAFEYSKKKTTVEKNCGEEYSTLTSDVFKCPEGKPYIHLSVFGKSAIAMCCEKE